MLASAATELIIIIFSIILCFSTTAAAGGDCRPASCNDMGPEIRFPFRLIGVQPSHCGYPGFDLTCNTRGETILSLPKTGDFAVSEIVYISQLVYLYDPDFCPGEKLLNFTLAGTAFRAAAVRRYTILECSNDWSEYTSYEAIPLFCRRQMNRTVLAMPQRIYGREKPPACRVLKKNLAIPLSWDEYYQYWGPLKQLQLRWDKPDCRNCEVEEMICGFNGGGAAASGGGDITCSDPPSKGIPRGVKYGIIIGIGIPGLVCLIGLACFACGKIRDFGLNHHLTSTNLNTGIVLQQLHQPPLTTARLDLKTIESYPKTVIGESRRQQMCSICLSEYEPKESVRTIPECNHYFHADCVDEWLRLNATCPLCRNSPDSPWTATPCSNVSLSSASLASSSNS